MAAEKTLRKRKDGLLNKLQHKFPQLWKDGSEGDHPEPPTHFDEIVLEPATRDYAIAGVSAVVMGLGVFYLHLRIVEHISVASVYLYVDGVSALMAAVSWFRAMFLIFASTRQIKTNRNQLILVSCLAKSCQIEKLPAAERQEIKQMIDCKPDATDCKLGEFLTKEGVDRLDLLGENSLLEWWELREYILVDFQDESAIMDASGVVAACLLVCFLFSATMEWSLYTDPLSPVFVLITTLSLVLIFAIGKAFEVCVEINRILARHSILLADAALEAQIKGRSKAYGILQAMQSLGHGQPFVLKLIAIQVLEIVAVRVPYRLLLAMRSFKG